jgi:filamentous hemagglutinin
LVSGVAGQNAVAGANAATNESLNNSTNPEDIAHGKDQFLYEGGGGTGIGSGGNSEDNALFSEMASDAGSAIRDGVKSAWDSASGAWNDVSKWVQTEFDFTGSSAANSAMSLPDAQAYAASRAAQLQSEIPANSQGYVTMGVGVVEDASGNQVIAVSTSEPRGYLRPGVTLNPGEVLVPGTGHAEADIVNWAAQNGYTVQTIGAGRPICPSCASAISGANGVPATQLKVPK